VSSTRFSDSGYPKGGTACRVDVQSFEGRCTVRLTGELDLSDSDMVRQALVSTDAPAVVVDLTRLSFIDATGMAALVTGRWHILKRGASCDLRGASEFVRRIFAIVGLADLLGQ
jgi:anti-sigma B factor antagonist